MQTDRERTRGGHMNSSVFFCVILVVLDLLEKITQNRKVRMQIVS